MDMKISVSWLQYLSKNFIDGLPEQDHEARRNVMEVDVTVVRGVAARLEGDVAEDLRRDCEYVHKIQCTQYWI